MNNDSTWRSMTSVLKSGSEKEVLALLEAEKAGQKRLLFIQRIYGRYSKLREQRERDELTALCIGKGGDKK